MAAVEQSSITRRLIGPKITMLTNLQFTAGRVYNTAATLKQGHASQAKAVSQEEVQAQVPFVKAVLNVHSQIRNR